MPPVRPPPRGLPVQHPARRPFRRRCWVLPLVIESLAAHVGGFGQDQYQRLRVDQLVFMAVRLARQALFSLATPMLSAGQTSQADNFSIATDTAGDQYCDLLATGVFAILVTPPSGSKSGRPGPRDRPFGRLPADPICRLRVPNRRQVGGDWRHPGQRPASWPPIEGLPASVDSTLFPVVRKAICGRGTASSRSSPIRSRWTDATSLRAWPMMAACLVAAGAFSVKLGWIDGTAMPQRCGLAASRQLLGLRFTSALRSAECPAHWPPPCHRPDRPSGSCRCGGP